MAIKDFAITPAAKEVQSYREAIYVGFNLVRKHKLLTNNNIIQIQNSLKHTIGGFRTTPGTKLKRNDGVIVSTGLLEKIKIGRENFYVNKRLFDLFLNHSVEPMNNTTEMVITE